MYGCATVEIVLRMEESESPPRTREDCSAPDAYGGAEDGLNGRSVEVHHHGSFS